MKLLVASSARMQAEDKRLMRAVVRRVHPDLFAAHPYERAKNTESLKARDLPCDCKPQGAVAALSSLLASMQVLPVYACCCTAWCVCCLITWLLLLDRLLLLRQ